MGKSVQFPLTREQILTVVNMLLDAKVGAIPQPGAKAAVPKTKAPLQLRGELMVIAGDVRTHRQQLTRGEQLEPLSQLVGRILAFSEKAAAGGLKASSLQDGLAKVGDGTLAPQTFSAFVRRAATEDTGESFLLRVEGRHVSDRLMPKGQLPPSPRELTLSDSDFRKLALLLLSEDPASMAPTTYAPTYTDVTVAFSITTRTSPRGRTSTSPPRRTGRSRRRSTGCIRPSASSTSASRRKGRRRRRRRVLRDRP